MSHPAQPRTMTRMGDTTQPRRTGRQIGQVAAEFGVTVRTLHHYDEIGLVVPSERTAAGYRLYTDADVQRLARVIFHRRLGISLEEVRAVLDGSDPVEHLRRHRATVLERIEEMHDLLAAIDTMMETQMSDRPATDAELEELFGDGFGEEYQQEAAERWGQSEAWTQSRARSARYTKADWEEVKAEGEATTLAFVAALDAGEPADSGAAMDAAEAARLHIHTRFYDTSPEFHRNLADMYIADPRFTKTYEDIRPGLAQYVRDAIHANADRIEGRD